MKRSTWYGNAIVAGYAGIEVQRLRDIYEGEMQTLGIAAGQASYKQMIALMLRGGWMPPGPVAVRVLGYCGHTRSDFPGGGDP